MSEFSGLGGVNFYEKYSVAIGVVDWARTYNFSEIQALPLNVKKS